jgi:hypothetical protein
MNLKFRTNFTTRKKKIQKSKKYRKLNITTSKRKIQKTKKYRKLNNITRIKNKKTKNTKWGGGVEEIYVDNVYIGKWNIINDEDDYGKMTYANGDVFEGKLYDSNDHKKNGGGIMTYKDGKKILGYWKDDKLINSLDENLGITIHRVNSPKEIEEGKKYLVMHNVYDSGPVFLFIGNININKERKHPASGAYIMDIMWEKDIMVANDPWRKPVTVNRFYKKFDNGRKYNLYDAQDALVDDDLYNDAFSPDQFNVIIFKFDDNIEKYINKDTSPGKLATKPLSLFYLSYLKLSQEEKDAIKNDTTIDLDKITPFANNEDNI